MYYDTVGHASGTEGHFLSENNVPKRIVLLTLAFTAELHPVHPICLKGNRTYLTIF